MQNQRIQKGKKFGVIIRTVNFLISPSLPLLSANERRLSQREEMNAFISKTILNGLFLAGIFGFPFRCFAANVVNWRRLGLAASRGVSRGTPRAIFARCKRAQTVVRLLCGRHGFSADRIGWGSASCACHGPMCLKARVWRLGAILLWASPPAPSSGIHRATLRIISNKTRVSCSLTLVFGTVWKCCAIYAMNECLLHLARTYHFC